MHCLVKKRTFFTLAPVHWPVITGIYKPWFSFSFQVIYARYIAFAPRTLFTEQDTMDFIRVADISPCRQVYQGPQPTMHLQRDYAWFHCVKIVGTPRLWQLLDHFLDLVVRRNCPVARIKGCITRYDFLRYEADRKSAARIPFTCIVFAECLQSLDTAGVG